ncbi:MAG: TraB/GumN family protein [Saprospiraceae bacterium]|nr:TraB/GumN family protein [Saprospiraceae bacterium]
MKLKHLFSSLSWLLGLTGLNAQDPGLLWKIEDPASGKYAYLFGTVHVIPSDQYFLPAGFEAAFASAEKIYTEVDMDEMQELSGLMGIMDRLFMDGDLRLSELLSESEYQLLSNHFDSIGIPLQFFERFKPLFLSALTASEGNPMAFRDGRLKSYELELAEMARLQEKGLEGLETLEFQLSLFDSIPYSVQAQMLLESVRAHQSASDEMYRWYREQEIEKLAESVATSDASLTPYIEMMLDRRNRTWVPLIADAMRTNVCLFAVGAGHLGGQGGVLFRLREAGFRVKRVQ